MSNSKIKEKKQKNKNAHWSCAVNVRCSCGCGMRGHVCTTSPLRSGGRVRGRRRWSLLGTGWCVQIVLLCSVLCVLPLHFCTSISGRVGSGQPNTYHAKNQKKPAIPSWPPWLWQPPYPTRHATAIRWCFFKFPPCFSVMAPPWPLFDNTARYKC